MLKDIKEGDVLELDTPVGLEQYRVEWIKITTPDDVSVIDGDARSSSDARRLLPVLPPGLGSSTVHRPRGAYGGIVRRRALDQTQSRTRVPRIVTNAVVIARFDAVSGVVQRESSGTATYAGGGRNACSERSTAGGERPECWRAASSLRIVRSLRKKFRSAVATWRAPTATSTDKHSPPVALATMRERIDHLARLRTANIEISGGEPLLHPDLDELIRHIRGTGALAGLITNGYLLNEKRIEDLNNAGLDHLQISIDNVIPETNRRRA